MISQLVSTCSYNAKERWTERRTRWFSDFGGQQKHPEPCWTSVSWAPPQFLTSFKGMGPKNLISNKFPSGAATCSTITPWEPLASRETRFKLTRLSSSHHAHATTTTVLSFSSELPENVLPQNGRTPRKWEMWDIENRTTNTGDGAGRVRWQLWPKQSTARPSGAVTQDAHALRLSSLALPSPSCPLSVQGQASGWGWPRFFCALLLPRPCADEVPVFLFVSCYCGGWEYSFHPQNVLWLEFFLKAGDGPQRALKQKIEAACPSRVFLTGDSI